VKKRRFKTASGKADVYVVIRKFQAPDLAMRCASKSSRRASLWAQRAVLPGMLQIQKGFGRHTNFKTKGKTL
jgi:hypothetical protein